MACSPPSSSPVRAFEFPPPSSRGSGTDGQTSPRKHTSPLHGAATAAAAAGNGPPGGPGSTPGGEGLGQEEPRRTPTYQVGVLSFLGWGGGGSYSSWYSLNCYESFNAFFFFFFFFFFSKIGFIVLTSIFDFGILE